MRCDIIGLIKTAEEELKTTVHIGVTSFQAPEKMLIFRISVFGVEKFSSQFSISAEEIESDSFTVCNRKFSRTIQQLKTMIDKGTK